MLVKLETLIGFAGTRVSARQPFKNGDGKHTTLQQQTIVTYGKPKSINSDNGSQYNCANWAETLQELDIRISIDGKGRSTDNAIIERWFRTLKQKYYSMESERLWTNTTNAGIKE